MRKFLSLLLTLLMILSSVCFVYAQATENVSNTDTEKTDYPMISVNYPNVYASIVDGHDNVIVEKTEKDGFSVIKGTVNLDGEFKGAVGFDNFGDNVRQLGIDLDAYKYVTLIYKYEGRIPANTEPTFYIASHSGEIQGGAVINPMSVKEYSGGWKSAVFEIPDLSGKYLHPENVHYLQHFHVNPFGRTVKVTSLFGDTTVYVGGIMFHPENNLDVEITVPYISGKGDGLFAPNDTLTRAEACVIVCNILGEQNAENFLYQTRFDDINSDDWFYGYVTYCESIGLLSAFGDSFYPNENISRDEFVDIILKSTMDVSENAAVKGNGTLNSLLSKYITRSEAVSFVNSVFGKSGITVQTEIEMPFSDVSDKLWAYSDIMLASNSFILVKDNNTGSYINIFEDGVKDLSDEEYARGEAKLAEVEKLERVRIEEIANTESNVTITGTAYYFSQYGDDSNDGKSPSRPKKSLEELKKLSLEPGDGVFFRSGDMFRGSIAAKSGVTYSSYGGNVKPVITVSPGNFTGSSNWVETDTPNVWKLTTPIKHDVGVIVFNDGEAWTEKRIKGRPDFMTGDLAELDKDLTMWHDVPSPYDFEGYIYLRSDKGNPGSRFHSIELAPREHIIKASNDIVIDNLCLKYTGAHGVSSGNVKNLTVQNCVFEFIGGSWFRTDTLSRYGNAVEVYGSCDGYVVDNCYITQVYDAGVTHQYSNGADTNCVMKDVKYTNNVITETSYPIEYFVGQPNEGIEHKYVNFEISGNIIMRTGYGFGHQRPDKTAATAIKGWNTYNEAYNYTITNNIFAVSRYYMMAVGALLPEWAPVCDSNIYIHYYMGRFGSMLAYTSSSYDANVKSFITKTSGDENVQVYYLRNPGDGN